MANISTYLQNIVNAVYGEDVRWSIHDAIDIINKASEVCIDAGTAVTTSTSSSTGYYEGSLYVNTDTCDLWVCTGTNAWTLIGNLRGIGIASIAKTATSGLVDTYTITMDDDPTTPTTYNFNVTNGKDGTRWYPGTNISGKSANPTVYAHSGITNAQVDDFYLNMNEHAVYCCTLGGDANTALWVWEFDLSGGGGYGAGTGIDISNNTISLDAEIDDLNDVEISSPADGEVLTVEINQGNVKFKNKKIDKSFVRYAGSINYADLLTYANTYLTAEYEDAFFLLRTGGTIGSGEASQYWSSNFSDGDEIPADSHIAVININRGTLNPAVYKYDDFGGFVNISGKADKTEIVHWVDATLAAGQSSYSISNSLFKTTSRIVAVLASDNTPCSDISISTNGTCVITWASALTAAKEISIGISNAQSA